MATRRDFLTTLGAAIGATTLAGAASLRAMSARHPLPPIGIQLYTVRSLMAKDVEGTLARLAEIGYREVEFAGYFGRTPAQMLDTLRANRLLSPSTHVGLPATDDAWSATLDDAKEREHEWVVIAYLDAELRGTTSDGWKKIAERFNRLGRTARERGLRFAYHNHDFEFARAGDGTALDALLANTDRRFVDFEMDVYWVVKGGGDPLDLIQRYPHRFPLMHLKDASAAPERAMVDVGRGTIDFKTILAQNETSGMLHAFVEHDTPSDPLESARTSYWYLSALHH